MRTPKPARRRWIMMAICLMGISMASACRSIAADAPPQPAAITATQEPLAPEAPTREADRGRADAEVVAHITLGFNIRGWT